ncbi:MAG: hypothetical protein D4S01_05080 [Dehalococcoidia bacterium]|nr:MAG: hypothetical protein D4S01_05080 [Dehalococcoidia bacterium]
MYLIKVHEDGDTEIKQVEQEPAYNSDILLHTVEDVARELKEYGHEEDAINEALTRASDEVDWVEV